MEKNLKLATIGIMVTGIVGLFLLLISLFSAGWISGDLPDTYTVNSTSTGYSKTNTSGSCCEGVFIECCNRRSYTVVVILPFSFMSSNNTDYSCYIRSKSDFHGEKHGGFEATQFFAAMSLILTGCGSLIAILFYCVRKLQNRTVVPLSITALFYGAVFCLTLGLIIMGAMYTKFTALLQPSIGWSLNLGVVADVVILGAALISTVVLVLAKRNPDQYESL